MRLHPVVMEVVVAVAGLLVPGSGTGIFSGRGRNRGSRCVDHRQPTYNAL